MDDNNFSLNYKAFKAEQKANEEMAKEFSPINEYTTNLTFESLPYEQELFKKDTILKEKRVRWHQNLTKDVYVEEALNVLNDLKMTYEIKKVATIKD